MNGELEILKKAGRIGFAFMATSGGGLERARRVAEDAKKHIQKREGLSLFCVDDPVIKREDAARAASFLRRSEIDALVIFHGTHSPSMLTAEIVRDLHVPLAVWGIPEPAEGPPYACGSMMGILAHVAALAGLDRPFTFAYGLPDSEEARREIDRFLRAVIVHRTLRRAKIGILGIPAPGESGSIDELSVKQTFGCEVQQLSLFDIERRLEAVSDEQIEAVQIRLQKEDYEFAVTEPETLDRACAALIATRRCLEDNEIAALATLWPQLLHEYRYSPGFVNAMLTESGLPAASEADANGIIMMLVQHLFTGRLPFHANWVQRDEKNNVVFYWNSGSAPPSLVNPRFKPKICDFYQGPENIAVDLPLKTGDVTVSALVCRHGRYKMLISGGRAIEQTSPAKGAYLNVRFEAPVKRLLDIILEHGFAQHYSIVHEDIEDDLAEFARQLNIEVVRHEHA